MENNRDKVRTKVTYLPDVMEEMTIQKHLKKGDELFKKGDYIPAIEQYSIVLGIKEIDRARQYLARCYYRLGDYEIAYDHFKELRHNSEGELQEYAASMIAAIEGLRGNYDEAIRVLEKLHGVRNLINLCIMKWKKYKENNDKRLLVEIITSLDGIDQTELDKLPKIYDIYAKQQIHHLKALIHQADKDYTLSENHYQEALKLTNKTEMGRGNLLDDYQALKLEKDDKTDKDLLRLDYTSLDKFLRKKGWNLSKLADKMELDYSQIYQMIDNQEELNKGFIAGLIKLCRKEGVNVSNFLVID